VLQRTTDWIWLLFGQKPCAGQVVVFFSARLDETGTDGKSDYAIVAGAVSTVEFWNELETKWSGLLKWRDVSEFHYVDFAGHTGDFAGWGALKRRNFVKAIQKIINNNTIMRIAVAVHRKTHTEIKKQMEGVKGFKADSDCGMCFRVARAMICEKLAELRASRQFYTTPRVQFIVEDGPYAADLHAIYQDIIRTKGHPSRAAAHAEMLAGFASSPKGELRSLEAADYINGRGLSDLKAGIFVTPGRSGQMSALLTPDLLKEWHEDMVQEKEKRRAYGKQNKTKGGA
jgi:hypothetical protein